jgi:hypothetical protein
MAGLVGTATPVLVLDRGLKRARVRLVHRLRWNRQWFEAGSTRYVPVTALGDAPWLGYLVGVGRGRFVPPMKPVAVAAVLRHASKRTITDRALRRRLSVARDAGKLGAR